MVAVSTATTVVLTTQPGTANTMSNPPPAPAPQQQQQRNIQAIPTASVAKICSGQVILDLSMAVKELLENALDAGATSVEIRLREHGLALIEVCVGLCCEDWQLVQPATGSRSRQQYNAKQRAHPHATVTPLCR